MTITQRLRRLWYKFRCRLCRDIVQEELTSALHPDFGWIWQDGERGGRYIEDAFEGGVAAVVTAIEAWPTPPSDPRIFNALCGAFAKDMVATNELVNQRVKDRLAALSVTDFEETLP